MGRRIFLSNLSCQILILTLSLLTNVAEDLKSLSIKFCKHLRKIDLPQAVMVRPAKTTLTARQATPTLFSYLLINNNQQFILIFLSISIFTFKLDLSFHLLKILAPSNSSKKKSYQLSCITKFGESKYKMRKMVQVLSHSIFPN